MMVGNVGVCMLVVGAILACKAQPGSERAAEQESVAGALIIGGLSLIGAGLDWILY